MSSGIEDTHGRTRFILIGIGASALLLLLFVFLVLVLCVFLESFLSSSSPSSSSSSPHSSPSGQCSPSDTSRGPPPDGPHVCLCQRYLRPLPRFPPFLILPWPWFAREPARAECHGNSVVPTGGRRGHLLLMRGSGAFLPTSGSTDGLMHSNQRFQASNSMSFF